MQNALKWILYFFLLTGSVYARSGRDSIEISLITCSEGDKVYAAFGHSAMRVINYTRHYDIVYNFGMFDFKTPNFTFKFIRGSLKYRLGIQQFDLFMNSYVREGRSVTEQRLNLPKEIKYEIANTLDNYYRPQNRYYLYHFLEKNCTTMLRDIIFDHLPVDLYFSPDSVPETYRDLLNKYTGSKNWMRVGINIIMGNKVDKPINSFQRMALPDNLLNGIDSIRNDSTTLVSFKEIIYVPPVQRKFPGWIISPVVIFSLMLILSFIYRKEWLQMVTYSIAGIAGLIIMLVWIFSTHMELSSNFNIFWLHPLYLIPATQTIISYKQNLLKWISLINLSGAVLIVLIWILKVQYMEPAFVPFLLLLFVLNINSIKHYKSNSNPAL